jgi:histidine triad (HIT) family protein
MTEQATQSCLLCRVAAGEVTVDRLFEDDLAVVFDLPESYPERQAPVHFVAISRRHIHSAAEVLDDHATLMARIFTAISQVARDKGIAESGYRIATNVGEDAGQTEFHLHLHVLGGRKLGPKG